MISTLGRLALVAGMAASVFTSAGCIIVVDGTHGSYSYHDEEPKARRAWTADIDTAKLDRTSSLAVDSRAGDVSIELTDGPARVEAEARGPDADRVKMVRLTVETDGDELRIVPRWPRGSWRDHERVDLTIYVPRRVGVEIDTSAGDIRVEGMSGLLKIESSAGDVEIADHDGPVRVDSSAGDIQMDHVSGDIEAETSAGDIDLHDVGWPIEALTSAGDVTVLMRPGFAGEMHAVTSAGDVRLPGDAVHQERAGAMQSASTRLGDAKEKCVFKTSAGDITVRVRG